MNQQINRKMIELTRFKDSFTPPFVPPPVLGKVIKLMIALFNLIIKDIKTLEEKIEDLENES